MKSVVVGNEVNTGSRFGVRSDSLWRFRPKDSSEFVIPKQAFA